MAIAILLVMGVLALGAIAVWVLAIRLSYRIERLRQPNLPRPRTAFTNVFASAFMPAGDDPLQKGLQARLQLYMVSVLACFLAMAILSFLLPLSAERAPGAATPPSKAAAVFHPPGTTLAYLRSNQNGTLPETVLVHVQSATEIHVAKMVSPCTSAAYVTATFPTSDPVNPAATEAAQLVGGRLQRDATQLPQAWLDMPNASRKLNVRLGAASAEPVVFDAPPAPWRMYDFDLAEFALFGPRNQQDFTFGVALAWPEGDGPLLRLPGQAAGDFLYSSDAGKRDHYRISGPAFRDPRVGDRGGEMIIDPVFGHVIEARLGLPNHPGYENFLLKLQRTAPGAEGETMWREALAAHWNGCPPAAPEGD